MELDKCENTCCVIFVIRQAILKGEPFIEIYKKAMKGVARINICARCIKGFSNQITSQEIQTIENRIALKELER